MADIIPNKDEFEHGMGTLVPMIINDFGSSRSTPQLISRSSKTTSPSLTALPLANRSDDSSAEAGFPIWAVGLTIALKLACSTVTIFSLIKHHKKKKNSKDLDPHLGENAIQPPVSTISQNVKIRFTDEVLSKSS